MLNVKATIHFKTDKNITKLNNFHLLKFQNSIIMINFFDFDENQLLRTDSYETHIRLCFDAYNVI